MPIPPEWSQQSNAQTTLTIGAWNPAGAGSAVPNSAGLFQFSARGDVPRPMKLVLDTVVNFTVGGVAVDGGNYDAFARIAWGSGRSHCLVDVDLVKSTVLSLFGTTATVEVFYQRTAADGLTPPPPSITVNAHLALGADTGNSQAQRSVFVKSGLANGADSGYVAAPKYAKRVSVYGSDYTAPGGLVVVFYSSDLVLGVASMTGEPLVLPNMTNKIAVYNASGKAQNVRAVFDLFL